MDRVNGNRSNTHYPDDNISMRRSVESSGSESDRDYTATISYPRRSSFRPTASLVTQGQRSNELPRDLYQRPGEDYAQGSARRASRGAQDPRAAPRGDASQSSVAPRRVTESDPVQTLLGAGFSHDDIEYFARRLDSRQRSFVVAHADSFRRCGYRPHDMIVAAHCSAGGQFFLLDNAYPLSQAGFNAHEINLVAVLPDGGRRFFLDHYHALGRMGLHTLDMTRASQAPRSIQERVLNYGAVMHARGFTPEQILYDPHDPVQRPIGRTRAAATPQLMSPALTGRSRVSRGPRSAESTTPMSDAELDIFTAMNLAPEALVTLAQRPEVERAFVASRGQDLIAGGLSLDEILQIAHSDAH